MSNQPFPKLILYEGFGEREEWEMTKKGWFPAVVEVESGKRYEIRFYDPVRLLQEYTDTIRDGVPCFIEFNVIIVPEVTIDAVRKSVQYLWEQKYFNFIQAEEK